MFFHPEKYGVRSYTGIWEHNVILEICGPFPDSPYSADDVMARCNTLIFRPPESAAKSALELKKRLIDYEGPSESSLINLNINALNTASMPVHISDSSHVQKKEQAIMDSLDAVFVERQN